MTRAEILQRYNIRDRNLEIGTDQEAGVLWRVLVHPEGDPAVSLLPDDALQFADALREVGDNDLADRFAEAANKAGRYQKAGTRGQ